MSLALSTKERASPAIHNYLVRKKIIEDVEAEIARARVLYPGNNKQLAAHMEELGEVTKELIDYDVGKSSMKKIYEEGIQNIAMSIRLLEEGSGEFSYPGLLRNE